MKSSCMFNLFLKSRLIVKADFERRLIRSMFEYSSPISIHYMINIILKELAVTFGWRSVFYHTYSKMDLNNKEKRALCSTYVSQSDKTRCVDVIFFCWFGNKYIEYNSSRIPFRHTESISKIRISVLSVCLEKC